MGEPRWIDVSAPEVQLRALTWGPQDAPMALCLHGFPDSAYGFRKLAPHLVAAGYRVVAPFMRGYVPSSLPSDRAYHLGALMDDALRVRAASGPGDADVVIGHDWGAAVAAGLAAMPDSPFRRAVVMSVPPAAILRTRGPELLRKVPRQLLRSWYMGYFQLPFLPERKLAAHGFRAFRSIFRRSSRPGTFSPADLDRYAAAAAEPGALRAMLHWYRAALRHPPQSLRRQPIEPPVRLIWGTGDVALGPEMIEPSAAVCERCELFRLPDAGHWVTHEAADEVNRLLLDFLT